MDFKVLVQGKEIALQYWRPEHVLKGQASPQGGNETRHVLLLCAGQALEGLHQAVESYAARFRGSLAASCEVLLWQQQGSVGETGTALSTWQLNPHSAVFKS